MPTIENYGRDVYRMALDAFIAKNNEEALRLATLSETPEGDKLVSRLAPPAQVATPQQHAAYAEALDAYMAGDEKKALSLAEALKGMPEADNLGRRIKNGGR